MKRPLRWLMVLLVLIPAAGVIYLISSPRLTEVAPGAQAERVAVASPLRLSFSRLMDPESVLERLTLEPAVPGEYTWEGNDLVFTPLGGWPAGSTVQVRLAPGARAVNFPGLELRDETAWSFTVRSPRLIYLFPSEEPADLYQLDPLTSENLRLTESPLGIYEFDASAGGDSLVYSAANADGGSDLYRLDLSLPAGERRPEQVLDCGTAACRNPRLSPQEDWIAYERSEATGSTEPAYARVWLLATNGEQEAALAGDPGHQTMLPSWSKTGRLAFYDTDESAYFFLDPGSGERMSVGNNSGQPGAWSPDGNLFVAPQGRPVEADEPDVSGLAAAASLSLVVYNLADGETLDLSANAEFEDAIPVFSPDGSWLAYAHKDLDILRWMPGRQLWLVRPDGSDAHPLTNDPLFNHYDFSWSPDGRQIAYVRFNQTLLLDPPELWLVDVETTQARKLVTGGFAPLWIP